MGTALRVLLPQMVGELPFDIHMFRGKDDLIRKLPGRLRGYAGWARLAELALVVVVDRDDADCRTLKARLVEAIPDGPALDVFSARNPQLGGRILNRIACEELEAWFLGDEPAVRRAYPRVPTFAARARFRDPDAVQGGTWEALEQLLQSSGYHLGGLPKPAAAEAIAPHMNVEQNRSVSFCQFRDGVRQLVGAA